jgi:HD superfamily phosphodiesterase
LYDFIYLTVHHGYDNYQEIADFIIRIIERVSFSKQKNNESKEAPSNHDEQVVLNIIRDSDRLEALGEVGVKRCEEFIRSRNGKLPEDFITHCHEKLLRLLPDGYITTQKGKELAKPKHEYLVKYVEKLKQTNHLMDDLNE